MDLKPRLAQYGFVSNHDYSYAVRCLLSAPIEHVRALALGGAPGRRKTAFAHALAQALEYPHVLYHEFIPQADMPEPVRILPPRETEEPLGEQPVSELDRTLSEACALSEGDRVALILDQLQLAEFRHHLRLADFIGTGVWSYRDVTLRAHPQNILVILISEEPLYHTLQTLSFKLWVDTPASEATVVTPHDLGLAENAAGMLGALKTIFDELDVSPTLPEYRRLVHDIHGNVNDVDNLKDSIYGWIEGIDYAHMHSPYMQQVLEKHMPAIMHYLGLTEGGDHRVVLSDELPPHG
ncbi:MAG: hypothetical protein P8Y78_12395 [Acidihalobacter sp.]